MSKRTQKAVKLNITCSYGAKKRVSAVLRIAFFFIPSAYGAAEAAYASLIAGFGSANPAAVALASVAIKRSQELLRIPLG